METFSWDKDVIPFLLENYALFTVPLILYPYVVNAVKIKEPLVGRAMDSALFVWNALQFAFSLYIFAMIAPTFLSILRNPDKGFHESICMKDPSSSFTSQEFGRYIFYFVLSKISDLLDTAFLILRGKPVAFLHWYHHWITLMVSYIQSILKTSTIVWVVTMNSFVHTIMYLHFALTTVSPSFKGNKWLTIIQILQMSMGTIVVIWHWLYCGSGLDVPGLTVYALYSYLFIMFFIKRYKGSKEKKTS